MSLDDVLEAVIDDALARGAPLEPVETAAARAYLAALGHALGSGEGADPARVDGAADAFGRAYAERGFSPAGLARAATTLSRALGEALAAHGGRPDRLDEVANAALVRALEAFELARVQRRDGWLAHYSHEMRNPLNTLVSAIWLLRNAEHTQVERVCDMAERAARRLEGTIKDVRELEGSFATPPPNRNAKK